MRALTIYLKASSSHRVLSWYNCNQFIIKRRRLEGGIECCKVANADIILIGF
jgi:hypothetical protein